VARPNWEYIRVDVLMPSNPKVCGLPLASRWLLVGFWCYCGQHLTDGFVPATIWRANGRARERQPLIDAGFAELVDGGYQMHDYLEHQRSRAQVEALSRTRAESGRKGGQAKAKAVASAKQKPARLLPERPFSKPSKSVAEAEAEAEAEQEHTVAGLIGGEVEGVIHSPPQAIQLPSGPWLNGAAKRTAPEPPASPRGRAETDAERRRQAAALNAWEKDHPEEASSALPA
jgi:hypothetical protein